MAQILEPCLECSASYPLSPLQEGMLVESLLAPSAGVNVTQVICSLTEAIDLNNMQKAWQQVLDRHDALRTSFQRDNSGALSQSVHTNLSVPFRVIGGSAGKDPEIVERVIQEERQERFDP